MRVLGLDLSLRSTGLALVRPPEPPIGRVLNPATVREAERLAHIGHGIREAVWELNPDLVAIEGYAYGTESRCHALGELGGVVRYLLHVSSVPYEVIPPAQWRKQLFGRNIPKDAVRVEAFKRYGIEFDSLDVLEAWCVGTAVLRLHEGLDKPPALRRSRQAAAS